MDPLSRWSDRARARSCGRGRGVDPWPVEPRQSNLATATIKQAPITLHLQLTSAKPLPERGFGASHHRRRAPPGGDRRRSRPRRAVAVRGQKNPRSPSPFVRGTTWTWRWATLWLTTLLLATNVPCAPSADGIAAATRCTRSKNGPTSTQLRQRDDVLGRDDEDVAGEQRGAVEEGDRDVVAVHDLGRRLAGDDRAEDAVRHGRTRYGAASGVVRVLAAARRVGTHCEFLAVPSTIGGTDLRYNRAPLGTSRVAPLTPTPTCPNLRRSGGDRSPPGGRGIDRG